MASTPRPESTGSKRVLVIYNPAAGWFRYGYFLKVISGLERLGCLVTIQQTTGQGDAETLARRADPARVDAVIAAGGDGTVNEVANGLLGRNVPLGIIPLGTANVLAAEIGLPATPRAIAATIAAGARLPCHPGRANGRLFLMMAGVGFDARVVQNTPSMLKKAIGKGAYVWATLRQLLRPSPGPYKVTLEGNTVSAASVVIGKGHFYAGRFVCTPDARLEQPWFQVCLFRDGGRLATLKYLVGFLRGRIPLLASVTYVTADHLRIEGPPDDPVQGDGDIIAGLPLDVRIAEDTIDLLIPA